MYWTGNAKRASNGRPDGSVEVLVMNFRHPRDYPDESQRISSYAGPLEDEACHGAKITRFADFLGDSQGCRGRIEFPSYALCFAEDMQACSCGCSLLGYNLYCALITRTTVCTWDGKPLKDRAVPHFPSTFFAGTSWPDDASLAHSSQVVLGPSASRCAAS